MKPDLLFIDYALNDIKIGLERAEKAWKSMIQEALGANVKLVPMTPTPDLKEEILDENATLTGYAKMIKRLGEAHQIPVVDVNAQFKTLKREEGEISKYMSQNNHPNELGHQVVLKEIVKELFE
jgi:acyl-CoA thioesterase I